MSDALKKVYGALLSGLSDTGRKIPAYWIPEAWSSKDTVALERSKDRLRVDPLAHFRIIIESILKQADDGISYSSSLSKVKNLPFQMDRVADGSVHRKPGDWIIGSSIYGIFVRNFAAYDHDRDGFLGGAQADITLNGEGLRETGTFLKSIALLPYVQALGFNTLYLLPVCVAGNSNKTGELPSPYAVRNPFAIDPIYHDPLLGNMDPSVEFRAFIEAAHILGMRVMLDFVFRTAARDCDFIRDHPEWFYWIDKKREKEFAKPVFGEADLVKIKQLKDKPKISSTIPPAGSYISLYSAPPLAADVRHVSTEAGYAGISGGREVIVPGAFSDWPPDDIQPDWTDVTYLKLYEDEKFNYVAYNTVRLYDPGIKKENRGLWETLAGILPFYQKEFGLDGARIDMAHALPKKLEHSIIRNARAADPDFAFISENFNCKADARPAGYNIIYGDALWRLCRIAMSEAETGESFLKGWIRELPHNPGPIFGALETPDTPRAIARKGGIKYSEATWVLVCTLPNMVPFCMAGLELGDRQPTNLGIDFTREEIEVFRKTPLAFYHRAALAWESVYRAELAETIKKINHLRSSNLGVFTHIDNFRLLDSSVDGEPGLSPLNPVIAYMRVFEEEIVSLLTTGIFGEVLFPIEVEHDYLVAVNMDFENERIATIKVGGEMTLSNIWNGAEYKTVDGDLNLRLKPGEYIIAVSL